jgi:hypothetical protein
MTNQTENKGLSGEWPATADQRSGKSLPASGFLGKSAGVVALDGFGYGATLRLHVGLTSFVPPALTLWSVLIRQKEMAASGLI